MGLPEYEKATGLMRQRRDLQHFVGARSEGLVKAAEDVLGLKFPPLYRRFLLEYGAGSFGSAEIYGVINEDFTRSSVPDAIWCTLNEREEGDLPANLLTIYNDGAGAFFCLDCSEGEVEAPIVVQYIGLPQEQQTGEVIAKDFGEFLLQLVQEEVGG